MNRVLFSLPTTPRNGLKSVLRCFTAEIRMAVPDNVEPVPALTRPAPAGSGRVRRWKVLAGLTIIVLAAGYGGWQLWGLYHLRAAEKALRRHEFGEALSEFEWSLGVWPRSVSTRLQAARAARRADRLERSGEYLTECEKAGITADTALERSLLDIQRGDMSEEAILSQLTANNHPDAVLIWEAGAKGSMQVHRVRAAIHLWKLVVEHDPDYADAHFWLGTQLQDARFVIDAIPSYQRAVQLAPGRTIYRLTLAEALLGFSKPSEAWTQFEELLRRWPDHPGVLYGAGRCRYALGHYQAAREYLDTLLSKFPDHADGWAERGRIYRDQGNRTEAIRCLRKAFELAPNNHRIGYTLLAELRGDRKTAEADALAEKIDQMTRDGQRLDELNAQLRKEQRSAPLRHEIGMIYMRSRAEAEAVRWLRGAIQDDPNFKPAHAALAEYYERTGNVDVARYFRERAGTSSSR
jgi:tetratricopeptide (TPR) repeat protein